MLQKAQKDLGELEREKSRRSADIGALNEAISKLKEEQSKLDRKFSTKKKLYEEIMAEAITSSQAAGEKMIAQAAADVAATKVTAEKELNGIVASKKALIFKIETALAGKELQEKQASEAHAAKIKEYAAIETEFQKRADKAEKDFEKIKKALLGDG